MRPGEVRAAGGRVRGLTQSACVLARQGKSCCAPWPDTCRRWTGAWVNTECVCLSQAGQELLCALARYVPQVDGCVGYDETLYRAAAAVCDGT